MSARKNSRDRGRAVRDEIPAEVRRQEEEASSRDKSAISTVTNAVPMRRSRTDNMRGTRADRGGQRTDRAQNTDASHEVPKVDAPQSPAGVQDISRDAQDTSWEMSIGPLAEARGWLAFKVQDRVCVQFVLDNEGRSRLFPQLGASDVKLLSLVISQMANSAPWTRLVDYRTIQAVVEFMQSIAPRDGTEIVLATHTTQIHLALMAAHYRLANGHPDEFDSATRAVNSLTRSLLSLQEALKRHRSGGEQRVTVRHVSVSDGGQAIVGNVSHTTARQALPDDRKQTPAITHSRQAPIEIIEEREREPIPVRSEKDDGESSR